MEIILRRRALLRALGYAIVALLLLHGLVWAAVLLGWATPKTFWVRWFDLDYERNAPTLYNTLLLLASAGLFYAVGHGERQASRASRAWMGLAGLFALLALDETAQFHEQLVAPLRQALGADGLLRPAWVLPYAGLILLLVALYWRWFWALPRRMRRSLLLAATLYLGGAVGFEMLGGLKTSLRPDDPQLGLTALLCAGEEGLEMGGIVVLLGALLEEIQRRHGVLRLTLAEG